jgi:hypothetical protein
MISDEEFLKQKAKTVKKGAAWVAGFLAVIIGYNSATLNVDSGEKVRVQNTMTGEFTWYQTEGLRFKMPFFTKISEYPAVATIAITDDTALIETSSAVRTPLGVTFADNYGGDLEASFRVKLPASDKDLERMHQDVKSQSNLVGNTYLTFAKDMLNLTTDQFLAQDFMQGGKGAFKQRLQEQADLGMRVTKREKVEIKGQVADQSLKGNRSQAATAKQFIYKVVSQRDENGTLLRRPHSLSKYGITIEQIDLGEFKPAADLVQYVDTIKLRERTRAETVAQQRIERDKAVTEQLIGDRQRITEKNKALMEKDREVIAGQKQVELAQIQAKKEIVERNKVAELAKIDKKKELQQATDNENIEKANEKAAKYRAQAALHEGLAQAKIIEATYKAYDKKLYAMEIQRDTMSTISQNLANTMIKMPQWVSGSANGKIPNSMDVYLQAVGVDKMNEISKAIK